MTRVFLVMREVAKTPHRWMRECRFSIISWFKDNPARDSTIVWGGGRLGRDPDSLGTDTQRLYPLAFHRNHARVPAPLSGLLCVRRRSPGRRTPSARTERFQGTGARRRRAEARGS